MEEYYFLTFASTNYALQGEAYLKENNHNITVIPTPREVTLSCGLSIKFKAEDLHKVKSYVEEGKVKTEGIYSLEKEDGIRKIEKVG